jgi:putative chitinase
MGNGSEGSGDGYRFRGRGFIGTTGRANYQAYADSEWCVGDLMSNPSLLAQSPGDQKSSMFFWWKNDCNKFADADDVKGLTKRINGGLNGFDSRKALLAKFKEVFNVK